MPKPWPQADAESARRPALRRRTLPLLLLPLAAPWPGRGAAASPPWRFDARDGEAGISVRAAGLLRVRGRFDQFAATVSESGAEARAAVASLSLSLPAYDETVRGPEWFDAARFPEAVLRLLGPLRPGPAEERQGALSLRGVTRPVVARLAWSQGAGAIAVQASCTVRRSEFGMVADQLTVGDAVSLSLSVRRQIQ